MEKTAVEQIYEWLDEVTLTINHELDEPYLDSLSLAMEILFHQEIPAQFDELTDRKLHKLLADELIKEPQERADIRKAVQLAILKGMKGSTQHQHLMTPETVALLVGYFSEKLMADRDEIRLFDPTSGTASLLTTVMSHLDQPLKTYAAEVDPTLVRLGVAHANLLQKNIEFFHQDSLRPLLLDPVDLVVSDLPVGYYPDDAQASEYILQAKEGHSYAHHLLIEQSLNYTKEGGYCIFVVPHFLFHSDQSDQLQKYLRDFAHIIGVIQLPESAFVSKEQSKSILIIRKRTETSENLQQPLLVQMPSFSDTVAMEDILSQMNAWFTEHADEL